jgi:multiple sugar transport system substrate-binding protein
MKMAENSTANASQRRPSRRQFVTWLGTSATGTLLASCVPAAPPAAPQVVEKVVTQEVEKVVTQQVEVEKVVKETVVVEKPESWVSGNVPRETQGPFRIISWADEHEMRASMEQTNLFFQDYYPNMKVEFEWGIPWNDYWTVFLTQIAAGTPVEMAWQHDTRGHVLPEKGVIRALDDYLAAFPPPGWPDRFYPTQVEAFRHKGKMYAIPWDFAPGGWYINVKMFEDAGVDIPTEKWTWDDILPAALKMTKDTNGDGVMDQWGVNLPTGASGVYWIVKSFGGDYWDETITKSMFGDPKTVQAFQYMADLMWKQKCMPSAALLSGMGFNTEFAFASGLIGMHYALNDTAARMNEAIGGKFEWSIAPTPTGPAGRFQFVGGSAWCVPASCRSPEVSYELIRYCLSKPENLMMTGMMGSVIVANMDFVKYGIPPADTGVDPAAFLHAFYDLAITDGSWPYYHVKYAEWESNAYTKCLDPLWVGEVTDAAAACACVDQAANEILQSA